MQRQAKVHQAEIMAQKRAIIQNDTEKLLLIQREGSFTYRAVDCLYNPSVCLKTAVAPCLQNGRNAEELGVGPRKTHALLCLIAPLVVGSYLSVGKTKEAYRKRNVIPGLQSDDTCLGCCCPWCLICQIRNELDTQNFEKAEVDRVKSEILTEGQEMQRQ